MEITSHFETTLIQFGCRSHQRFTELFGALFMPHWLQSYFDYTYHGWWMIGAYYLGKWVERRWPTVRRPRFTPQHGRIRVATLAQKSTSLMVSAVGVVIRGDNTDTWTTMLRTQDGGLLSQMTRPLARFPRAPLPNLDSSRIIRRRLRRLGERLCAQGLFDISSAHGC
jgi:hypothetical protein